MICEHEIILWPKKGLSIQVKQFTDAVKVTTINPEYKDRTKPYRVMNESVRKYLESLK